MIPLDVFGALDAAGVSLRLDAGRLKYSAPAGAYTPELRALVREHRAAIVAELERQSGLYETLPSDFNPLEHYRNIPCDPEAGLVGLLGVVATGDLWLLVTQWELAVRRRQPEAWELAVRYWTTWCRVAPAVREVAA